MASSSETTRLLELLPADSEGDPVSRVQSGVPVTIDDFASTPKWPRFAAEARNVGFCSVHAVPLAPPADHRSPQPVQPRPPAGRARPAHRAGAGRRGDHRHPPAAPHPSFVARGRAAAAPLPESRIVIEQAGAAGRVRRAEHGRGSPRPDLRPKARREDECRRGVARATTARSRRGSRSPPPPALADRAGRRHPWRPHGACCHGAVGTRTSCDRHLLGRGPASGLPLKAARGRANARATPQPQRPAERDRAARCLTPGHCGSRAVPSLGPARRNGGSSEQGGLRIRPLGPRCHSAGRTIASDGWRTPCQHRFAVFAVTGERRTSGPEGRPAEGETALGRLLDWGRFTCLLRWASPAGTRFKVRPTLYTCSVLAAWWPDTTADAPVCRPWGMRRVRRKMDGREERAVEDAARSGAGPSRPWTRTPMSSRGTPRRRRGGR